MVCSQTKKQLNLLTSKEVEILKTKFIEELKKNEVLYMTVRQENIFNALSYLQDCLSKNQKDWSDLTKKRFERHEKILNRYYFPDNNECPECEGDSLLTQKRGVLGIYKDNSFDIPQRIKPLFYYKVCAICNHTNKEIERMLTKKEINKEWVKEQ